MLATQSEIETLADRIERAYQLRRPFRHAGCSAPGVWAAAASALMQIHYEDPSIPLDPELYVASQSVPATLSDPWSELAQPAAAHRYRARIRQIVQKLRAELRSEIRHAERRVAEGEAIEVVLQARCRSLSPLGRYIVAHRAGRTDLKDRWFSPAAEQHDACPLYRQASQAFLQLDSYPVPAATVGRAGSGCLSEAQALLN